jgi:PTH1 family peptidyl-tRNA hydrolase
MIDVIAEAEGISLSSMQFKAMVGKGNNHTKVFFFT